MALPATLVWEARPTNGTADAGGGFDPAVASAGTDFSQQNAVQQAYTDLVVDAVTNTDVTSAARAFSAVDVGNNIAITTTGGGGAWTIGIYNIRSLQGGTKARLDRSPAATGSTAGVGNLGGARSGFSSGVTTMQASLVAGNKVWVKNEAWNEAISFTVAASAGTPTVIEGYNTARGDAPLPSSGNQPRNNRAAAALDALTINTSNYLFKYLHMSNAGDAGFSDTGSNRYEFCRSSNNTGEGWELATTSVRSLIGCESDNNTGVGLGSSVGFSFGLGLYVHDNGGAGISGGGNTGTLVDSIIETNVGGGYISFQAATGLIKNNTFNANSGATADGFIVTTPNAMTMVLNNIFSNNGRDGIRATDGDSIYCDYNAFFGNSGVARTNVAAGPHDSTSDPQFTNAASGDYSIGTNLKAAGWPGSFAGGLSTGYMDMGAVQRQEAGGSGSSDRRQSMTGGIAA